MTVEMSGKLQTELHTKYLRWMLKDTKNENSRGELVWNYWKKNSEMIYN